MDWTKEKKILAGAGVAGAVLVIGLLIWKFGPRPIVVQPPPGPEELLADHERERGAERPTTAMVALDTSGSMVGYFNPVPKAEADLQPALLGEPKIQFAWNALEKLFLDAGSPGQPSTLQTLKGEPIPIPWQTIWSPENVGKIFKDGDTPLEAVFDRWIKTHATYDQPGNLIVVSDGQESIMAVQSMIRPGDNIARWLKGPLNQDPSTLPRPRGFAMIFLDLPFSGEYWSEIPTPNTRMGLRTGVRPLFVYLLSTSQSSLDKLVTDLRKGFLEHGLREQVLAKDKQGAMGWTGDFHILNLTEDLSLTQNRNLSLNLDPSLGPVSPAEEPNGLVLEWPRVFYIQFDGATEGPFTVTLKGFKNSTFWQDRRHQASDRDADKRPEPTPEKAIRVAVQEALKFQESSEPADSGERRKRYAWTEGANFTSTGVRWNQDDLQIQLNGKFTPMERGAWKLVRAELAVDPDWNRNLAYLKERSTARDDKREYFLKDGRFQALGLAEFVGNIVQVPHKFMTFYIVVQQK